MTDRVRLWVTLLLAVWAMAYGYSVVALVTTEPTGDGFTRGANRVMAFLGWQGISGMLAIPIWAVGRQWPKGSGVRRISILPLGLALLLVAVLIGLIIWARLFV